MQHTYQRDAPQPPCCCCWPLLLCAAPLPLCSAAQVQLVWLCNHWVRLHSCTLPVLLLKLLLKPLLWLGLAWVEEFKLSLSLELAWLGYLGLGTLTKYSMKNSANCPILPIVYIFPPSLRKYWRKVQGMKIIRITIEVL